MFHHELVDPANWVGLEKFELLLENLRVRTTQRRLPDVHRVKLEL